MISAPILLSVVIRVVYAAQPREGTETPLRDVMTSVSTYLRFMQLNPARGRKLDGGAAGFDPDPAEVYAAQPREGTETC